MEYVDIDTEIEKEAKSSISRIFSQFGEEHFRSKEKEMVAKISRKSNQVISAGGGVVLNFENIENLEKDGLLFCLEATPEVIFERTRRHKHRPLLETANPQEAIREILKKREKNYQRVENHIDTSHLTPEEVAEKIIVVFRKKDTANGEQDEKE